MLVEVCSSWPSMCFQYLYAQNNDTGCTCNKEVVRASLQTSVGMVNTLRGAMQLEDQHSSEAAEAEAELSSELRGSSQVK